MSSIPFLSLTSALLLSVAAHASDEPALALPSAQTSAVSAEQTYIKEVIGLMASNLIYPKNLPASAERPVGKVRIGVKVARSGEIVDAALLTPTEHEVLNEAATDGLKRILTNRLPPFPETGWPGQEIHVFSGVLSFAPPPQERRPVLPSSRLKWSTPPN